MRADCIGTMALKMIRPAMGTIRGTLKPPVKLADPFYQSSAWVAFASDIKRQRGWKCEDPDHKGDRGFKRNPQKLHADHIVERKDGGADFDPLNIALRCIYCHNRKTGLARKSRTE